VPWAAGTLYWRELLQQINIAGPVERLDNQISDALFARRSREAQAATIVSHQSESLDDEDALRAKAEALIASGEPLARPQDWAAYRLVPEEIEFWQGNVNRLHRRLLYRLENGEWLAKRLQP
jgi:pyridoxamine 5'-phosphate oxidase